jgi:cell fate regulator YaaT (PSP1 superfamily)
MGVQFHHLPKLHYVHYSQPLALHTWVLVDTPKGLEIGEIKSKPKSMDEFPKQFHLDPIVNLADEHAIQQSQKNELDAKQAFIQAKEVIASLHLKMDLFRAEYTFDRSKLYLLFMAEERVDFRDLVKQLASLFHTRIDLRQVGARDRAKLMGAIGVCGLPLCCTTFLNEFDNISMTRAKNQMLALNIPKLTGHCGKLLCCLKYEDDAYTELKATLPKVGDHYVVQSVRYRVSSINVLSRIIKLQSPDRDLLFLHVDELKKSGNQA